MNELIDFINAHAKVCPLTHPEGISLDLCKVVINGMPEQSTFLALIGENKSGFMESVDALDGKEHSFIELGAWLGSQGLAMAFMAIGVHLKVFSLLSPSTLFPGLPDDVAHAMAGSGLVSIVHKP